jgi:anti-sigma-K factor RskA
MNGAPHIPHDDLALYALGALAPDEAETVRAHLAECAECRAELAALQGDLALLALSVQPQSAPEGSLARLMSKLPAKADEPGQAAEPMASAVARPASAEGEPRPRRSVFTRPWAVVVPWALAAVLAVACVLLGVENANLNDTVADESALVSNLAAKASRSQEITDALSAPNAQRVTLTTPKAPALPSGQVIYLPDRGALLFSANHLKPLPPGKTYELWVIPANGQSPIPAGVFHPNAQGEAEVTMPHIPSGIAAKEFGVTIENGGGSSAPTLPIVLAGE